MGFLGYVVGGALQGAGQGLGAAAKFRIENENNERKAEILAQKERALAQFRHDLEQPGKDRSYALEQRQVASAEKAAASRGEAAGLRHQLSVADMLLKHGKDPNKLDPTSFIAIEQELIRQMPPAEAAVAARERATVLATDRDGSKVLTYNHNGSPMEIGRLPPNATAEQRAQFEQRTRSFLEKGLMGVPQEGAPAAEGKGLPARIGEAVRGVFGGGGKARPPDPVAEGITAKAAQLGAGDMSAEQSAAFAQELAAKRAGQDKAGALAKKQLRAEWEKLDLGSLSRRDLVRARDKYWSVLSDDEKKQLNLKVR